MVRAIRQVAATSEIFVFSFLGLAIISVVVVIHSMKFWLLLSRFPFVGGDGFRAFLALVCFFKAYFGLAWIRSSSCLVAVGFCWLAVAGSTGLSSLEEQRFNVSGRVILFWPLALGLILFS